MLSNMALVLPVLAFLSVLALGSTDTVRLETYIVHLSPGLAPPAGDDLESWYRSFLPSTVSGSEKESRMVFSYRNVLTGFAAKLLPEEVKAMDKMPGFLSASPDRAYSLHTTHTPSFLGLQRGSGFWRGSNYGRGVVIGVLDTGITPGHPSFNDEGVPPPPAKWKGKCELMGASCNNKLIGAQDFTSIAKVDDKVGHGTHTSSTAAGSFVAGANDLGNANGTAAGMAPLAHLAMYKVCIPGSCLGSSILAGIDTAIHDGVDVLSISLGGISLPFYDDPIAVGAFSAIQKGIFVSCSAGNLGPLDSSLSNEAPWILTVGASTVDRSIRVKVSLGNNSSFNGESLFQPANFSQTFLPLVYPGAISIDPTCPPSTLRNIDVKGKVVLCERSKRVPGRLQGSAVKDAGGAAMILVNKDKDGNTILAQAHVLPAARVSSAAGAAIKEYIGSTKSPVAKFLFKGTVTDVESAPAIASFSSRGPNSQSPGILKPDITGPGVNIIAAWPFQNLSNLNPTFKIISGTSMSCPHLAGIAALIKAAHPKWSPAAIKSAIMTTANITNLKKKPIEDERGLAADLFAIGAGHVNPSRSSNPGLVYDIRPDDYIPYLCGLGYDDKQVKMIVYQNVSCSKSIPEGQLNYPSFAFAIGLDSPAQTYYRTVTNVGAAKSTYTVNVVPPPGVKVRVNPAKLVFSKANQKLSYQVTFSRASPAIEAGQAEGALTWSSRKHSVRSPISVMLSSI